MIDAEGFRPNVGIVICNHKGQVFWARRFGQHSWQYPQGGMDEGETAEQTMYRELEEEVGLKPEDVEILSVTKNWLRYRLPKRLIRRESTPVCIGQKQKWFLLRLRCKESDVNLLKTSHPEFDDWRWVSYWYPVRNVVSFKRDVYRRVMKEFASVVMPFAKSQGGKDGRPTSHRQKRRNDKQNYRNKHRQQKRKA
ncbi:MAG: RNA pyrophosphohydrolase [Gammaproteobacteria bacterium]|nr:RNA pyrophosphohydrolase [Gammaproteobacteria bacterium]